MKIIKCTPTHRIVDDFSGISCMFSCNRTELIISCKNQSLVIDANQTTLMSIMIFMRNLMIGKYHKYPLDAIKENIIITITNNKLKNQNKRVSKQSNETKQKKIFT